MGLRVEGLQSQNGEFAIHVEKLNLESGLYALMGPSGSGKSTLLLTLSGFLKVKQGKIFLNDVEVQGWPPEKRRVAISFQQPSLFPHLNVFENIAFGLRVQKTPATEIKKRVLEWMEKLEILGLESRDARALSGGQIERVALARSLAVEFPILLLDEPFSQVDEELKERLGKVVKNFVDDKKICCLWVTHDSHHAQKLASSTYRMEDGRLK